MEYDSQAQGDVLGGGTHSAAKYRLPWVDNIGVSVQQKFQDLVI